MKTRFGNFEVLEIQDNHIITNEIVFVSSIKEVINNAIMSKKYCFNIGVKNSVLCISTYDKSETESLRNLVLEKWLEK